MPILVDKRGYAKDPEAGNRQRFLDRCKGGLRGVIDGIIDGHSIKNAAKTRRVSVSRKTLNEPVFSHDNSTGKSRHVFGGNKDYYKGDKIPLPSQQGNGSKATDDLGEFSFILTKKEFLNILFEDMALPNYIKESLNSDSKFRYERAGTCLEAPITRLDLLKTMFIALGRKFASKKKKPAFITEEDLRFKHYTKKPVPIRKAAVFMIMDVSGSMGDYEKALAKRFFLLLYLFLEREYETVDIRFIIHHSVAMEVDEARFFGSQESGGTIVRSAMELTSNIINKEYDIATTNIYVAQVSDGDDWEEGRELTQYIEDQLLHKVQYFAYLQVNNPRDSIYAFLTRSEGKTKELGGLFRSYKQYLVEKHKKFNIGATSTLEGVFPVLQRLFKKGDK